ncbi:MAG TPA: phage holin family protein [Humisphaera sp.]
MASSTPPPEAARDRPFGTNGGGSGDHDCAPKPTFKEAVAAAFERFGEIREYAGYYASVQADAMKSKATWAGVYAALGLLGAVIGMAVLATAAVLFVTGLAGALSALFGTGPWLGQLIIGFLLLAGVGVGALVGIKVVRTSLKRKLMAKYEQRHQEQRERFGADVVQRSREEGAERL